MSSQEGNTTTVTDVLNKRQLQYPLCALVAVAVLLNLTLFVWHCLYFPTSLHSIANSLVRLFITALHIAYVLIDVAVALLLLNADILSIPLCKAAGFFIVYSILCSLWTLAPCAVFLFAVQSKSFLRKKIGKVCDWQNLLIMTAVVGAHIFLIIVSLLPLTDLYYFQVPHLANNYYYVCAPLQLPTITAWQFSTFIVMLVWIPMLLTAAFVIFSVVHHCRITVDSAPQNVFVKAPYNVLCQLIVDSSAWTLTVLLFSINYFSSGQSIVQNDAVWLFAYLCSFTTLVHPCVKIILLVFQRKKDTLTNTSTSAKSNNILHKCPKTIQCIKKISLQGASASVSVHLF